MSLEQYLNYCLIEEKSTIEELLKIDNGIQMTKLTYLELLSKIRNCHRPDVILDSTYHFVIDGEPDTLYTSLLTFLSQIKKIHISRSFVGINKWLVERALNYCEENGIESQLLLDTNLEYINYDNSTEGIVIYGFPEFVQETKKLFHTEKIIEIEK